MARDVSELFTFDEFLTHWAEDRPDRLAMREEDRLFTYAELEEEDTDLKKLQGWLEKIRKLDFYGAPLREEAESRLRDCEELLDSYAQRVFDAHDENR